MNKETLYWTTKDGRRLNVDDMDDNHVRNAFKMLIRQHIAVLNRANNIIAKYNTITDVLSNVRFGLKGDMAQEFNDFFPDDEDDQELDAFDFEPETTNIAPKAAKPNKFVIVNGLKASRALTADQMAEAYKKLYGGTPRIKPMDVVFYAVAKSKKYIVCDIKGTLHKRL